MRLRRTAARAPPEEALLRRGRSARTRLGVLVSSNLLSTRVSRLAALVLLAGTLQLAAGIGMAYLAGFGAVRQALGHLDARWLAAMVASLAVSFAGYYLVYREIYEVEDGPGLSRAQLWAAVAAGFGGFLAHGGSALDLYALRGAGAGERDAKARVVTLGGLEHGVLALGGCAAAIAVLVAGRRLPPASFSLPWAIAPLPGFVAGFLLARRYEGRFDGARGWRAAAAVLVEGTLIIERLFRRPVRHAGALGGMALYWAGDLFAGWCGLALFGVHLEAGAFVVGFATGVLFSRRTGPLAGAGILTIVLSVTVWASGAPLAATVAGVFAYRFVTLWLPLPFSLAALPTLRCIGEPVPGAPGRAEPPDGEPALEHDG